MESADSSREGPLFLYRDQSLVVINKPSGLLVHRGFARDDDTAMFRVRDAVGQHVYPVHRLDRGASGALLLALTRDAASSLGQLFQERRCEKRYWALVRGVPPAAGEIDYPLPKDEDGERVPAFTRYRLLARSPVDRCSLVEAQPETGRLHQIRRHLRHINHPLIGDVKHGNGPINRRYRELYQLHRLALHARSIAFAHPVSGEWLSVQAPLPDELRWAFELLGIQPASLSEGQATSLPSAAT